MSKPKTIAGIEIVETQWYSVKQLNRWANETRLLDVFCTDEGTGDAGAYGVTIIRRARDRGIYR